MFLNSKRPMFIFKRSLPSLFQYCQKEYLFCQSVLANKYMDSINDMARKNISSFIPEDSEKTEPPLPSSNTIDFNPSTAVEEGQATVNFPSSLDVFYNPVQEFNRDISIAVLRLYASDSCLVKEGKKTYAKTNKLKEEDFKLVSSNTTLLPVESNKNGIKILEALSASGLRSIRYAKEVGGVKEIIANDISKAAIECMKLNLRKNGVDHIVTPSLNDASLLMYQNKNLENRFDVVDLDPYGSPHMFLDGAVQCIADGGLLLVTCTDMAVLCGNSPETCNLKYGALSMKHKACHEMGLRIILQCIESNANKYGRYIVPLLSLSADFYCRVFVQVFTSQVKCKESFSKLSWVHQCTSCEATSFQPLGHVIRNGNSVKYQLGSPTVGPICKHCGGFHHTAGPIWTDPIHDLSFVSRLRNSLKFGKSLGTLRRIEGTLSLIEEELPDVPLYYVLDKLFSVLRMSTCRRREFASALLNSGWKVSPTHAHKNGIKTDAPMEFIWEIMKAKEKQQPINIDILPLHHPARAILRGEKKIRHSNNRIVDKTKMLNNNVSLIDTSKLETGANIKFNTLHVDVLPDSTVDIPREGCLTESVVDTSSSFEGCPGNIKLNIDFSLHPDAESESEKRKFLRFQINPERNWGPKMKATTSLYHGDLQSKSKSKQGKRKRKDKIVELEQHTKVCKLKNIKVMETNNV